MLAVLLLFYCLLAPFIEAACHEYDSIFHTGRDTESSVAVLLLIVELACAALPRFARAAFAAATLATAPCLLLFSESSARYSVIPLFESSPPAPLRV